MHSDGTARLAFEDARRTLDAFAADDRNAARVERVADLLAQRLGAGGKLLACGNGGSAAQAAHLCEELTGRFRADRPPIAAIACAEAGHITCTANDYGFDAVFERWVTALATPTDALVLLSTSGRSENIARAARVARQRRTLVIGLLGRGGGQTAALCDEWWDVAADTADRVQEVHTVVLHALIEAIEARLARP